MELKPKAKIKKEKEDLTFETRDLLARRAERANEIRDARMCIMNAKKAEQPNVTVHATKAVI